MALDHKRKRGSRGEAESDFGTWPFPTDYNDHFSTTDAALADLVPGLDRLASALGKTRDSLVLYDPFYCDGSVVQVGGCI